jgi:hypothetical protein
MAKSMLLKTKSKKKTVVRQSKLADEKYTGLAPNFNAASTWTEQKLKDEWRRGMYYYNYHYTCSDLRKYVSQLGTSKYNWSKQDFYAFSECEDHRIVITLCAIAKMSMDGAPAIEDDTEKFITKKFTELLAYGHSQLAAKTPFANVVKLTIQDRMREKLSEVIGEIEEWYDKADAGKKGRNNDINTNKCYQSALYG